MDTFTHNGRAFAITLEPDVDTGPPWKECAGHGVVSDWTRRDKRPGERILSSDKGAKRFYDVQKTLIIAARDGWGLGGEDIAALAKRLGREPTPREIICEAVDKDFDYLRRWCADLWSYVGVCVKDLDTGRAASLWGVEDSDRTYIHRVAAELADELFPLASANEAAALELATD